MRRQYPLDAEYARSVFRRRSDAGLSQLDLALRLGCSESLVSKMERQSVPVAPHVREAIDHALADAGRRRDRVPA